MCSLLTLSLADITEAHDGWRARRRALISSSLGLPIDSHTSVTGWVLSVYIIQDATLARALRAPLLSWPTLDPNVFSDISYLEPRRLCDETATRTTGSVGRVAVADGSIRFH